MAVQECLVLIKPDGLVKSLTGYILSVLSETKLKIIGAKVVTVTKELAEIHYAELKQKKPHIFENVLKYIQGEYHTNRVLALVYYGEDAISKIRAVAGSTNPEEADPTTIRGRFGRIHTKTGVLENVMHASDSEETAKREIQLWFSPDELTEKIYPTKKETVTEEKTIWT